VKNISEISSHNTVEHKRYFKECW